MGVTLMDGVLYIADSRNNAIRAVSVSSGKVTTVSGSGEAGSTDGKAKDARSSLGFRV
jgi:ribosomal protein S11